MVTCATCTGSGQETCFACGGSGSDAIEGVIRPELGPRPCRLCGGQPQQTCRICRGTGQTRQLTPAEQEWRQGQLEGERDNRRRENQERIEQFRNPYQGN